MVSQERTMVDRLENYILAMGIRGGKRFRETWERTYRGAGDLNVTEVNAFKDWVLAPIFAMILCLFNVDASGILLLKLFPSTSSTKIISLQIIHVHSCHFHKPFSFLDAFCAYPDVNTMYQ